VTVGNVSRIQYADTSTMRCVFTCPSTPSYYGDNATH
jgi:hypothetical protein